MSAPTATPEPRNLLVADDDDDVAIAVTRIFERRGWSVNRARSGSEAVAMARGEIKFAAAVVDLVLPGVGGLDVVKVLRAAHPACRIVAVTGLVEQSMMKAFASAGADAFVGKPFTIDELVKGVEP